MGSRKLVMSCNLPEEIVEDILLRCSPKCLITCKRVCKPWYALITGSSFVRKHLRVNADGYKRSPTVNLVMTYCVDILSRRVNSLLSVRAAEDNDSGILPCAVKEMDFPAIPNSKMGFPDHVVSAYCDGIVCLLSKSDDAIEQAILVNPALGEFRLICRHSVAPEFRVSACGFGYDSRANDYKYVQIQVHNSYSRVYRAMVYTLGNDSWREIEIGLQDQSVVAYKQGVYHEGVVYWACAILMVCTCFVLSFDIAEEVFETIALPDDVNADIGSISLAVWNEQVSVFFCPYVEFSLPIEMWIMVENFGGVEGFTNWTKHLTIKPPEPIFFDLALTFWKDDELLLCTEVENIVSYNLSTQKLRKLPLPGWGVMNDTCGAHVHTPSLVSVKPRNAIDR